MADNDEKAKAEKLAAARKRVAQLQKQKAKKGGKKAKAAGEPSEESSEPTPKPDEDNTAQADSEPGPEPEKKPEEPKEQQETATESFPDVPVEKEPDTPAIEGSAEGDKAQDVPSSESGHRRQQSLSLQSQMRSSSFRKSSITHAGLGTTGSGMKSPPLVPLSPDGSTAPELFRKQALRLEELEKENKRLAKELEVADAKWKKSDDALEELREANADTIGLKGKLAAAEKKAEEVDNLTSEITALERQNSQLQTKSHRSSTSIAAPRKSSSPQSELQNQLEGKSKTIEAMELEISQLRDQLNSQIDRITNLEERLLVAQKDLSIAKTALAREERGHTDSKTAMNRMIEKSMYEGVTQASAQTQVSNLKFELEKMKNAKTDAENKRETMQKKLEALGNLHKESEARHHTRLAERDKFEKDVLALRRRLVGIENENLRLKEERERARKREAAGTGDDEALDELEEEERSRLERRIRDLEGEVFELRRGIWKERKRELTASHGTDIVIPEVMPNPEGSFDDVDLMGGGPDYSRRRSNTASKQRHSSFATVLSSGLAAFTGASATQPTHYRPSGMRRSLEQPSEKDPGEFLEDDGMFDEDAFARAQAEEEAKNRQEWEREVKSKVKQWKGWRLDLVECRYGAQGAGVGLGEIFDL